MAEEIRFAPLDDGSEEDCQCARCGSSCYFADCYECGGEGEVQDCRDWNLGGLIEDYMTCRHCRGTGGWWICCSGADWCEANPIPGRESIERGQIEWFTIPSRAASAPSEHGRDGE